jgi:hypothetical protein
VESSPNRTLVPLVEVAREIGLLSVLQTCGQNCSTTLFQKEYAGAVQPWDEDAHHDTVF